MDLDVGSSLMSRQRHAPSGDRLFAALSANLKEQARARASFPADDMGTQFAPVALVRGRYELSLEQRLLDQRERQTSVRRSFCLDGLSGEMDTENMNSSCTSSTHDSNRTNGETSIHDLFALSDEQILEIDPEAQDVEIADGHPDASEFDAPQPSSGRGRDATDAPIQLIRGLFSRATPSPLARPAKLAAPTSRRRVAGATERSSGHGSRHSRAAAVACGSHERSAARRRSARAVEQLARGTARKPPRFAKSSRNPTTRALLRSVRACSTTSIAPTSPATPRSELRSPRPCSAKTPPPSAKWSSPASAPWSKRATPRHERAAGPIQPHP